MGRVVDRHTSLRVNTKRSATQNRWLLKKAVGENKKRWWIERKCKQTKLKSEHLTYRKACRRTNKTIQESLDQHFRDKLKTTADSSRQRWSVIRELLHQYFLLRFYPLISVRIYIIISQTFSRWNFFKSRLTSPDCRRSRYQTYQSTESRCLDQ